MMLIVVDYEMRCFKKTNFLLFNLIKKLLSNFFMRDNNLIKNYLVVIKPILSKVFFYFLSESVIS